MWDDTKQRQLDSLWRRAETNALVPGEEQQLTALLNELDREEWEQLRPVVETMEEQEQQLRAEVAHLQADKEALIGLAQRFEDWLARTHRQAAELLSESEALRSEAKHDFRRATD
jgi:predicted  nucleic acid-binding Zn-ribbon protein